jgi:hypothetical protein
MKIQCGDLVQLNDRWDKRIGIVKADDKAWYVTTDHWDIAGCICEAKDVVKILQKRVIPKRLLKYVF